MMSRSRYRRAHGRSAAWLCALALCGVVAVSVCWGQSEEAATLRAKGINLVVLLDISGSMDENGNLSYAPTLARRLLGDFAKLGPTNIVFVTFDNQPYDKEPASKLWVEQNPDIDEFARRMEAAAVADPAKRGTEREWAMSRGLQLLGKFVDRFADKGYDQYLNLVVVLSDNDADPKSYRENAEYKADAEFVDATLSEERLEKLQTNPLRDGKLIIDWYQYTMPSITPSGVAGAEPAEYAPPTDVMTHIAEALGVEMPGTPPDELERAKEEDREANGLTVTAGDFRAIAEDPYTFEGEFTVSSSYGYHWVIVGIAATATAVVEGGALKAPTVSLSCPDGDLAGLIVPPARVDDSGATVTASVPISARVSFVDRPSWTQLAKRKWTGEVALAAGTGHLFDADPTEQNPTWRDMNVVGEYDKGLGGSPSASFGLEVSGPKGPIIGVAAGLLAIIAGALFVLSRGAKRVPIGLQASAKGSTYFCEMTKGTRVTLGGADAAFGGFALGEPFDGLADGAAEVYLGPDRVPRVKPREGVTLQDAAGLSTPELALVGAGSFSLAMLQEGRTVVTKVDYAEKSFGPGAWDGGDVSEDFDADYGSVDFDQ